MTEDLAPARRRRTAGPVRKFSREIAPGVVLHDLVLGPAAPAQMPFVINTARVEPGACLPLHHHDQDEIWVVSSGTGTLRRGEETLTIGPGDVLHFWPDVEHQLTNDVAEPIVLVSVYWRRTA